MNKKNVKVKSEEKSSQDKKNTKFADLRAQVKKAKEELNTLQLDHVQGKLKNTTSLTKKRKEIARLLTALRAVELTNA